MPKIVITPATMPKVLRILDKWRGKLTWDLYCEAVAKELGLDSVDRGTLNAYAEIKTAFRKKKERLRDATEKGGGKDVTIDMLQNEVEALESQVGRLQDKLNKYKEKFIRWQYNMYMMPGLDFEKLEKEIDGPLPPVDRSS